jgi:hypothetical protein
MERIDRRSALALGLAATSAALVSRDAAAQQPAATAGKELAPGVQRLERSKRPSMIPGYKTVSLTDIVYQPKAKLASGVPMANDMVCHCAEGELRVKQPGMEFVAKMGDVWSCNKGLTEETENIGTGVAIMRIINLLPT